MNLGGWWQLRCGLGQCGWSLGFGGCEPPPALCGDVLEDDQTIVQLLPLALAVPVTSVELRFASRLGYVPPGSMLARLLVSVSPPLRGAKGRKASCWWVRAGGGVAPG